MKKLHRTQISATVEEINFNQAGLKALAAIVYDWMETEEEVLASLWHTIRNCSLSTFAHGWKGDENGNEYTITIKTGLIPQGTID